MAREAALAALRAEAARLAPVHLRTLIAQDPARADDFALQVGPLYASFARQHYDRRALEALFAFAQACDLAGAVRRQQDGEIVNPSEGRAALHTALRGDVSPAPVARAAHAQALAAQARMAALVEQVQASGVTDVVSIGIGGSDLGPRLAVDALAPRAPRLRLHFLSNVDAHAAERVLAGLDPARTAAVVISKTFTTQETLLNGRLVRAWLGDDARLYAVSASPGRVAAFGIPPERSLPMWDWVGGRYSLWSAVGLPIALALGMEGFRALLAGAAAIDRHVREAPLRQNLPAWLALTAFWNRNLLGRATQAVLPYDERLRLLPAYLQQLVMESLGKSVRLDGTPVALDTVRVWWGGVGTDVQHSFFQALHQGTQVVPADFIGVRQAAHAHAGHHRALLANLLAQGEALANGQPSDDPHRAYPGGRPSSLLLLDRLDPGALGALLALYEHATYLLSVLWQVNAFDQFGVELGKQLAQRLLPALQGQDAGMPDDPVTRALLARLRGD
ncbi:glucose-6-phosphate isomerase [Thermomonas flagellata]|uniref:glucose-6-phosphate isomerase n=1 Tax=Thermomonas flagellata TaxID=2888524 RepID=UPI001F0392CE|nr:glucose-6-phosphate isomerase [Thermomonas flagellata]